jgi:hypothetical protein
VAVRDRLIVVSAVVVVVGAGTTVGAVHALLTHPLKFPRNRVSEWGGEAGIIFKRRARALRPTPWSARGRYACHRAPRLGAAHCQVPWEGADSAVEGEGGGGEWDALLTALGERGMLSKRVVSWGWLWDGWLALTVAGACSRTVSKREVGGGMGQRGQRTGDGDVRIALRGCTKLEGRGQRVGGVDRDGEWC